MARAKAKVKARITAGTGEGNIELELYLILAHESIIWFHRQRQSPGDAIGDFCPGLQMASRVGEQ
jgi:hypothetical protein